MIGLVILLAAADFQPKPSFGFACQPKDSALTAPTFEYRIFLPSQDIPVSGPAKVEITKLQGIPGAPDHLTLEGKLDRIQAMPSPDGKFDIRLARVEVASTNLTGGHSYTLDMWFGVKFAHDANGQATFAGIVPSHGTLRAVTENMPKVELNCPDLTGRAVQKD